MQKYVEYLVVRVIRVWITVARSSFPRNGHASNPGGADAACYMPQRRPVLTTVDDNPVKKKTSYALALSRGVQPSPGQANFLVPNCFSIVKTKLQFTGHHLTHFLL